MNLKSSYYFASVKLSLSGEAECYEMITERCILVRAVLRFTFEGNLKS